MLGDLVVEIANSKRNIFVVLDDDNNWKGLIYLDNIRKIIFNTKQYDSISIKSLMQQPTDFIYTSDTPQEIMLKFKKTKAWNLPVLENNENSKYIGFLSRSKVMTSYHDLLLELSYNIDEFEKK
jgi:CIC family chloride channel protein